MCSKERWFKDRRNIKMKKRILDRICLQTPKASHLEMVYEFMQFASWSQEVNIKNRFEAL